MRHKLKNSWFVVCGSCVESRVTSNESRTGLTMVEILLAVAILALLAGGMFFVSGKVREQANIRLTESTLAVLDTALEQYYDYDKSYPPDVNYASAGNTRDIIAALGAAGAPAVSPAATGYGMYNDACSVEVAYYYLHRVPQSRAVLSKLPDTAVSAKAVKLDGSDKPLPSRVFDPNVVITITGVGDVGLFRVVDAWNMPLQYIHYRANIAIESTNFPLLRSAGPDKKFGTTDDIVNRKN
ncbi:MAG: hypothetical protein Q7T18_12445 [Sedimentisphaerales bacterium]|nr:hypothetical protein [Sedimentisphaerales bacterium]